MISNDDDPGLAERRNIPSLREIVEERKIKVIETLSAGYAKNRLPLEEYERLVEYINKIESERELVVVEKMAAEYNPDTANRSSSQYTGSSADRHYYDEAEEDYDQLNRYPNHNNENFNIQNNDTNITLLSSRVFSGPVKSSSQHVSILGSEQIKIKRADLRLGQTFLDIVTILGDSVIYVEEGIRVVNKAIPVLGSAGVNSKVNQRANNSDQELIISGIALLGNVNVKLLKEK